MGEWTPIFNQFFIELFSSSFTLLTSEMIYRFSKIIKEILFYDKHYPKKNRYVNIIKNGFTFNDKCKKLLYVLLIFYTIIIAKNVDNISSLILNDMKKFIITAIIYLIFRFIKLNENYIDTAEWIRSTSGIDYATGMASNYFHGYLHLQLPDKGDGIKGIRERITDYEDKQGIEFAVKRLFILIPDSLHCKPKIESKILEKANPLECVQKDRAGVKRPFKNDVYKFTKSINNKTYYVSVEGATPLLSFYEAMKFDITSTPIMKAMHREILFQFYKSVKKFTTECPDTRNECEIVYYNDYDDQGNETDVGYVLKNHIEKMLIQNKS